jgi:periplasmic mercuric ion binding protein
MNIVKSLLTILITCHLMLSCKDKATEIEASKEGVSAVKKEIKAENLEKTSFTITGMTCAIGCAKTIQEELTMLEGVQTATVDFEKKLAIISFDKTLQTPESLTKVVEKTGDGKTYKVSNIKS